MNRTYKYQVINKIKELQKLDDAYNTDLRKDYNQRYMRPYWTITKAGFNTVELGETLADCMETLDVMIDQKEWESEQQAKWESEQI